MSVNKSNPDEFAYGSNEEGGCPCPVLAATGMTPDNHSVKFGFLEAAESYDTRIQEWRSDWSGVVSQAVARDAWIEVIEHGLEYDLCTAEPAIEVAEQLGWVKEGEYEV